TTPLFPYTTLFRSLDVVGYDVLTPVEQSEGLCASKQRQRRPRTGTEQQVRMIPTRTDDVHHIAADELVNVNLPDRGLESENVFGCYDRPERLERMGLALAVEDVQLVLAARIAEPESQHEAVKLRLGQRKRPLILNWILRRQYQK